MGSEASALLGRTIFSVSLNRGRCASAPFQARASRHLVARRSSSHRHGFWRPVDLMRPRPALTSCHDRR